MEDVPRALGIYSLQIAAIVAAAAGAGILMRSAAPRLRLACWRIVVALCLLLPLAPPRLVEIPLAPGPLVTGAIVGAAAPAAAAAAAPRSWTWILWAIAIGIAARGVWLAVGLARLRSLRSSGAVDPLPEALDLLHRTLAPKTQVLWHARVDQPVTFGFRRPVILMPVRVRELPLDLQRAVLCHELLHAARGDWMATLVEEAVRTVFWFHPAMWWAIGRIQLCREETVDALAVAVTTSRRSYMQALLAFADAPAALPAPAPLFAHRRQLVVRIRQLSQEVVMSRSRIVSVMVVVSALVAASGWTVVSAFPMRTEVRYVAGRAADVPLAKPAPRQDARLISLDFDGADVRSVLRVFEDITGLKLDVDPSVTGKVTTSQRDVPWDRALATILRENNLAYSIDGGTVHITPMAAAVSGVQGRGQRGSGTLASPPPPPPPPPPPEPADGKVNPRVVSDAKPEYPVEALRYNPGATVWVTVKIGPSGEVTDAKAARWRLTIENSIEDANYWASKPERAFIDAAEAAALKYKFAPPEANTRTQIELLFTFRNIPGGATQAHDPGRSHDAVHDAGHDVAQPGHTADHGPVRVGGGIRQPIKVRDVKPVYPPDARAAGIQGVVILDALIGADGSVIDVKVVRSIPMLDQAAVDAVRQWQFAPTLLNGEPVQVRMTLTVNFVAD